MHERSFFIAARQYLAIVAWAFWMGGFSFYFGIVVPLGGKVVGASEQGFVTQQVTHWLNLIGTAALLVLVFNGICTGKRLQIATLVVMVVCQALLFVLHGRLDSLIDATARTVDESGRFHSLHETYEQVSTMLWLAAMVYAWGFATARPAQTL